MQTKAGAKKAAETRAKNRKIATLKEKRKYEMDRKAVLAEAGDGLVQEGSPSYKPQNEAPRKVAVGDYIPNGAVSAKQHTATQLLIWAVQQMCKGAIPSNDGHLMVVPTRDLESVRILANAAEAVS